MILISEEELGEVIDITEEMCNQKGWVKEVLPLAQKRMDVINKARSRPYNPQSGQCPHWLIGRVAGVDGDTNEYFCNANPQAERDKVLDEVLTTIGKIKHQEEDMWLFEAIWKRVAELRKQEQP